MSELARIEARWKARPQLRPIVRIPRGPWPIVTMMLVIAALSYFKPDLTSYMPAVRDKPTIGQPIVGSARVIDGDTIDIGGERIRLSGIDSPELSQTCEDAAGRSYRCGAAARQALDRFLSAAPPTRCNFVSRDRYGRFVGNCYRADSASVSSYLVRNGFAMNWARYGGTFASEERAAQHDKRGMWAGSAQPPWEWRAQHAQH